MDLFDYMREKELEQSAPLASRIRPQTLDDIVGQQHILGKNKFLYRAIKADKLSSIILYGPPGCGKTTIARVISSTCSTNFLQINATGTGKKDMEEAINKSKNTLAMYQKKTILFIDEIHRFNKAQQDYLLPFVEDGTVILIGATTENPYFEVNSALISRSTVLELKLLSVQDIKEVLLRCLKDPRGLLNYKIDISDEAVNFFAQAAAGDARAAINALEIAVTTTDIGNDGYIHIDLEVASECIQKKTISYDKSGDNHYDTISAFIKSMRGSDPDASVYYLSRMLYAGEDIKFIARRIMICAAEDVGNADPMALVLATSAAEAVERLGMPEARIVLAQAVLYIANAPKSNSAIKAIDLANASLEKTLVYEVPMHLRDKHYSAATSLGRGVGYLYPHDYPKHFVKQNYLPKEMSGYKFYHPSGTGLEQKHTKRIIKDSEQYDEG